MLSEQLKAQPVLGTGAIAANETKIGSTLRAYSPGGENTNPKKLKKYQKIKNSVQRITTG